MTLKFGMDSDDDDDEVEEARTRQKSWSQNGVHNEEEKETYL